VTFSIVARTPDAQFFGVAIASSSPAVAARCAHARAGAGAVATQNITDPALGPIILESLSQGGTPDAALEAALGATPFAAYRQVSARWDWPVPRWARTAPQPETCWRTLRFRTR
jgi:uncharacterized Ntn-hydrolase superfamily protein